MIAFTMTSDRPTTPASPFWHDRRGTSAVEFALMAPVFLLLLLGMTGYGIYFGAAHSIQQIAADAARTALAGLDESERVTLTRDFMAHNAAGYPFIEADKLVFNVAVNPSDPNQLVVLVAYDARALPIWSLFPDLPLPGTTITRKSTVRIGGL